MDSSILSTPSGAAFIEKIKPFEKSIIEIITNQNYRAAYLHIMATVFSETPPDYMQEFMGNFEDIDQATIKNQASTVIDLVNQVIVLAQNTLEFSTPEQFTGFVKSLDTVTSPANLILKLF